MDLKTTEDFISTVESIQASLNASPDSWRDHVRAVRDVTSSLEITDSISPGARTDWQVPLIQTLQRVAFADADNGGVLDIANWCLRQALSLLQVYPQEVEILKLIGQNWLLRAQKPLSKIHLTEWSSLSSGSGGSQDPPLSASEEQRRSIRSTIEAEDRLHSADYVEARGILLPAVEYLKYAVDAAVSQSRVNGCLLAKAAEAYMSLGNVSSARINRQHFHEALAYLRKASEIPNFELPPHLQQYLDEYGPLDLLTA